MERPHVLQQCQIQQLFAYHTPARLIRVYKFSPRVQAHFFGDEFLVLQTIAASPSRFSTGMASYIPIIVQQIFSSSIVDSRALNATADPGLALSNRTTETLATGVPQDLASFIALLFSYSALRDWLKLIIIGGFFETCRRLVFATYNKIVDSFFICASFDQGDASYSMWLAFQS